MAYRNTGGALRRSRMVGRLRQVESRQRASAALGAARGRGSAQNTVVSGQTVTYPASGGQAFTPPPSAHVPGSQAGWGSLANNLGEFRQQELHGASVFMHQALSGGFGR